MSDLRERLIEIEPLSIRRQEQFEKEVQAMFEQKLNKPQKAYWTASVIGSAIFIASATIGAVFAPTSTQRLIWGLSGLAYLFAFIFEMRVISRGSVNFRSQMALSKALPGIVLLVVMALIVNGVAYPSIENLVWMLGGIAWLIMVVAINLYNRIMLAEINQKEQSLKLEYRLAELSEKLASRR